jgi:hypothetical protein
MKDDQRRQDARAPDSHAQRTSRVRLPGFLLEKEIGLGDVIKHVTSSFGIAPCAGCDRRAATLNNWIVFGPQEKRK